jgi:hypothetical protein
LSLVEDLYKWKKVEKSRLLIIIKTFLQAGLTPLETRQLALQEERVHGACRTLKQQIDSFLPSGRTLFSRLDDLIDTLKVAKDKARHEIGEYHKIVVRLLDNRGVHVQMY